MTKMFQDLLNIIRDKKKALADFQKILRNATSSVFDEKDEEHGGGLIHWAALLNRKSFLEAIEKFLKNK